MSSSEHPFAPLIDHLNSRREHLMTQWGHGVNADPKVKTANQLSRREFKDHIPQVLHAFEVNLRGFKSHEKAQSHEREMVEDAAQKHGAHRWQQGYSLEEMAREWEHLNIAVLDEMELFALSVADGYYTDWGQARRVWAQTVGEGISSSAARFDDLARQEAKSRMHDLEDTLEGIRILERERGEILRQASHDLRGSLTVVTGATSLLDWNLLQALSPTEGKEVLRILNAGVGALSQMVGDMLDLARLEAGQETRTLVGFDVGALLQDLGENSQQFAREKDLELKVAGAVPFAITNDANKVRRIAQNLLLNAIKYTPQGWVSLTWRALKTNDNESEIATHWELSVADTGPGFKAKSGIAQELDQVTKEARSIGASIPSPDAIVPPDTKAPPVANPSKRSRIISGEGVGLSIVKRLCELLDATLELETGQSGSKFRVVFPITYSDEAEH